MNDINSYRQLVYSSNILSGTLLIPEVPIQTTSHFLEVCKDPLYFYQNKSEQMNVYT